VAGFEPATTRTPSVCATRLRHTPTVEAFTIIRTLQDYTGSAGRKTISLTPRASVKSAQTLPCVAPGSFHKKETQPRDDLLAGNLPGTRLR
jgi:hypothetical protein